MTYSWFQSEAFTFDDERQPLVDRLEAGLRARMEKAKPKRYRHSLGVAQTAASMALAYGVDAYQAYIAGLVHDWDKVVPPDELVARAIAYHLPISGSPALAVQLLHGPVAAVELPQEFPDLPQPVLQAVARHTVAARDMTPLDMIVFVADAIEPGRRGEYADHLRSLVGEVPLEDLFLESFAEGLVYVIEGGRYVYPTAVEVYNSYVLKKKGSE